MYLGAYDDPVQLAGLGSKLKKAFKKVTQVVTKPMQQVHRVIEAKLVPEKLMPLVGRVHKSIERGTAMVVNPLDAPRLVKEEIKQMQDARKDPRFMQLVGQILAVVAVVYPFLQPIAAAMQLVQVAAERAAAKKLMAKDQAEADAAQAEFDKYVAELAALQKESERLKAVPIAPSPAAPPGVIAAPVTPLSVPLSPVLSLAPARASAQGIERERAAQAPASDLPSWVKPAAVGAAAIGVALLMRSKSARRRRAEH